MTLQHVSLILAPAALLLLVTGAFMVYVAVRYGPIISRIFEEKPLFLPLRVEPDPEGEDVHFPTEDGLALAGTYYRGEGDGRLGVIVFCHEYLGNRWSCQPYTARLRQLGFDVFSFDFRNHGESDSGKDYKPLQWVSDYELADLRAALAHLRGRDDRDPAGFGLFGVSRGGGTALVVGAGEPDVWGVISDGAFPTRGTMLNYIRRWAEIYVSNPGLYKRLPQFIYRTAAWAGRARSEKRLNCRYPDVERGVAKLSPRPWLMIHGEKDAYIVPKIALELFDQGREPKEYWIVPKAKHNRCLDLDRPGYESRLTAFVGKYGPRPLRDDVSADSAEAPPSIALAKKHTSTRPAPAGDLAGVAPN